MTIPRHKIRAVTVNGITHYAYAATNAGARNAAGGIG